MCKLLQSRINCRIGLLGYPPLGDEFVMFWRRLGRRNCRGCGKLGIHYCQSVEQMAWAKYGICQIVLYEVFAEAQILGLTTRKVSGTPAAEAERVPLSQREYKNQGVDAISVKQSDKSVQCNLQQRSGTCDRGTQCNLSEQVGCTKVGFEPEKLTHLQKRRRRRWLLRQPAVL